MLRNLTIIVCILIGLTPTSLTVAEPGPVAGDKACVILLHGMGDSPTSMQKIETFLLSQGYETLNLGYPSTSESIERIAEQHITEAVTRCGLNPVDKIHFVAHSLGGIIVRQYLQAHTLPKGSRLVMLAPPNQGSEVVDYVKKFFLYKWIHGPPGQELGTTPESTPNKLKPIDIEVGVIAGDKSLNPIFSGLIPGPDDGRVSVERAKLAEMSDFLVISSTHKSIVRNPAVLKQVAYFLEHGKFDHTQD